MPKSPTSVDLDRARAVLNESIAFRTSLIASCHEEIRVACWEGWDSYLIQKQLMKFRDRDKYTMRSPISPVATRMSGGAIHYAPAN
jgi:hypothetical protein